MKRYIKENKKVYDILAQEYKEQKKNYIASDKKITAPFISYLKENFKKIRVLELGPGSGLNLSFFEKEKFETTALEISEEIIKISKETSSKTKYLLGDFLEYNLKKEKFEGIFAKAFVHLFTKEDAKKVLKKIYNLLEKRGIVFIATTIHEKSEEGFFEKEDYQTKVKRFRRRWTEEDLLKEIKNAGLKIYQKSYHIQKEKNKKWINVLAIKS